MNELYGLTSQTVNMSNMNIHGGKSESKGGRLRITDESMMVYVKLMSIQACDASMSGFHYIRIKKFS